MVDYVRCPSGTTAGSLRLLATALTTIDEETPANLAEFTETGLGHTVGAEIWKGMMATRTFPFTSQVRLQGREEGREQGREQGRVETLVAAILKVLGGRGIALDLDSRERIESCRDGDVLDLWLERAVVVAKASDLFS
jgi:hypothetical protein